MVSTRRSNTAAAAPTPPPRPTSPEIPRIALLSVDADAEAFDAPLDRRSDYYRLQALSHAVEHPPEQAPLLNVPNVLTFARLVAVPVLVAAWFSPSPRAPLACALLFVGASLTDWLDGYIARRFEIVTAFGAFLDPVADKVMVTAALILMTLTPPPPLDQAALALPVIAIICREVTMSALREWAAAAGGGAHGAVKVNALGKWKTALQMVAMSALLFCRDGGTVARALEAARCTREGAARAAFALLWAAAALALWSLAAYFKNVWTHFVAPLAPPTPRSRPGTPGGGGGRAKRA